MGCPNIKIEGNDVERLMRGRELYFLSESWWERRYAAYADMLPTCAHFGTFSQSLGGCGALFSSRSYRIAARFTRLAIGRRIRLFIARHVSNDHLPCIAGPRRIPGKGGRSRIHNDAPGMCISESGLKFIPQFKLGIKTTGFKAEIGIG